MSNNTYFEETTGITYHHDFNALSDSQRKLVFIGTLKWALKGGYVGDNAGVYMTDHEAYDGDVSFSEDEIAEFMKCPVARGYAKRVAEVGRPVHWPQVITLLEEPWQKRYKMARSQMRDDAETCAADIELH